MSSSVPPKSPQLAPRFTWDDRSEMLSFVAERSFATFAGNVDGRMLIAHAPVLVDPSGDRLLLHFSRGNPLARALPVRVVAVLFGPDAYVSPDWYAEPDQVPTWNYVAVEIEGVLEETDATTLREIVDRLSAEHERRLRGKEPWTSAKVTPSVLAAKLAGIVGVTLSIEAVRGTRKLSQNKSAADRTGVITELAASPRDGDRALAGLMKPD